MPDASYLSLTGAKLEAAAAQTRFVNSVLHLFQAGFSPTPTSTLADFLAHECDFDNYAPITIVAWHAPVLAGAAYAVYASTQTFLWAHVSADVGNAVGGSFLVTAGGDLVQYTIFDPTRPCQGPDQAIITAPTDVFVAG